MSSLFNGASPLGGSTQQSSATQTNQAYPYLQGALSGNVSNGSAAGSQIANLLGLNGSPAQNQGFTNWQNSTGYQFGLGQGLQSVNGSAATQGLLNSGGNEKALQTYGQNYANTQYGNYTNQLQSLLGAGNTSAGVIGSAGNTYNSQSSGGSSNSVFGSQGSAAGGLGQLVNKLPLGI
jgi:hypothetical protein